MQRLSYTDLRPRWWAYEAFSPAGRDYTGRPPSGRRSHADSGVYRIALTRVRRAGAALALETRARRHPVAAGAGDRHRYALRGPEAAGSARPALRHGQQAWRRRRDRTRHGR